MKKSSILSKVIITLTSVLQLIIFVIPVQAANRNDALSNMKKTFNSPVSENNSIAVIIFIIVVCAGVIWFFYYNSSQEKKAQLNSHRQYQEKKRTMKPSGQQKRNWFRLKTRGELMWIPAEQAIIAKNFKYKTDHLLDVSGGGLCFTTAEPINQDDEIRLILTLGEGNPITLGGQVIRVAEKDGINTVSVEYIGIRDGQRDRIVSWILKNQRSNMQNEKPSKEDNTKKQL